MMLRMLKQEIMHQSPTLAKVPQMEPPSVMMTMGQEELPPNSNTLSQQHPASSSNVGGPEDAMLE